jgi:hypothetical protein
MYDAFCEFLGEKIEKQEFYEALLSGALSDVTHEYYSSASHIFSELLAHINDVLTYVKRAFNIDKIDKIFVGSTIGKIKGFSEFSNNYLGYLALEFDFDYGFENREYVDQVHSLMHLFMQIPLNLRYECSFSTYDRPPIFIKRKSGQLITISAISLIASLAYPVTYWSMSYIKDMEAVKLNEEYKVLHNERTVREKTIALKLQRAR